MELPLEYALPAAPAGAARSGQSPYSPPRRLPQPQLRCRPDASTLSASPLRTAKWQPPVRGGSRAAHRTVTSAAGSQPPRSPAASCAPIGWAPRSRQQPRRAAPGRMCRWGRQRPQPSARPPPWTQVGGGGGLFPAPRPRGGRLLSPSGSPRPGPEAPWGLWLPGAAQARAARPGPERRGLPRRSEARSLPGRRREKPPSPGPITAPGHGPGNGVPSPVGP